MKRQFAVSLAAVFALLAGSGEVALAEAPVCGAEAINSAFVPQGRSHPVGVILARETVALRVDCDRNTSGGPRRPPAGAATMCFGSFLLNPSTQGWGPEPLWFDCDASPQVDAAKSVIPYVHTYTYDANPIGWIRPCAWYFLTDDVDREHRVGEMCGMATLALPEIVAPA